MHARWLVEIATLFAIESKLQEDKSRNLHPSAAHRYWAVSRQRFENWQAALSEQRDQLERAGASERILISRVLRPIIEEIFLSDVPTRVLAAYGARLEADAVNAEVGPIAHNIFTTHQDIRNRCLRLLVSQGLPVDQTVELNRIRYGIEHWTDTFIAQFSHDTTRLEYAFLPDRTAELIDEAKERSHDSTRFVAWQLMTASCQKWMNKNCRSTSANPVLNQQLGEAVLAMLHPEKFPSLSPFPLPFSERVTTLIDQTNLWVSQLITPPQEPSPLALGF
jgi:hypothetical protein